MQINFEWKIQLFSSSWYCGWQNAQAAGTQANTWAGQSPHRSEVPEDDGIGKIEKSRASLQKRFLIRKAEYNLDGSQGFPITIPGIDGHHLSMVIGFIVKKMWQNETIFQHS